VTVLDAYAIVALLRGEPAAQQVKGLLDAGATLSAVNLAEVVDVLVRVHGRSAIEVGERLDWLEAGGMVVVPVDAGIGRLAGALHAGHYHRTRSPLSLADCVALATAIERDDDIATADEPLLAAARAEACPTVPLVGR
jgi:PIN domain nuclease of toxin-antitoxin system